MFEFEGSVCFPFPIEVVATVIWDGERYIQCRFSSSCYTRHGTSSTVTDPVTYVCVRAKRSLPVKAELV